MAKNYAVKEMGKWADLEGKIFINEELGMTGAQASFQKLNPGDDAPFLHSHKNHEELYIILSGEGEYQVDGEVFPVKEGSVIRVSPAGVRALRNNGKEPMVMFCVQYSSEVLDSFMVDGNVLQDPVKW